MSDTAPTTRMAADAAAALREALGDRVVLPEDPTYPQAAMPWNLAVPQQPAAVVEVRDADDVVTTVRLARQHGLTVSAQPVGHGATRALTDVVLLRTTGLDSIDIDLDAGVARVGAGVTWGRVLAALDGTGRIAMAGSNPSVSVVGLMLGGGMSWFGRRYGISARTLRSVRIVDGEGTLRHVDDSTDPELMWALRGGGGEYGVVVEAEIALLDEPLIAGGKLLYPVEVALPVLTAFLDVNRDAPDTFTCWASLMHFPDVEFLPEPLRGQSFVNLDMTLLGTVDELEALIAPLRAAGPVVHDTIGEVPIGSLGQVADEPTDPAPSIDYAAFLTDVTADTVRRIVDVAGDRTQTALLMVEMRPLGGAFHTPSDVPAAIDEAIGDYAVVALGMPMVPELVEPILGSQRALAAALAHEAAGGGHGSLTFHTEDKPIDEVYSPSTLDRLRAVKARTDPDGVIRGNFPIGAS